MPGQNGGAASLLVGTAGWSVPARDAAAFPADGSHLVRYAARLNGVEINTSFARPHRRVTYERWAASVPAGFRFSVKMPRTITHDHALQHCAALLDRFLDETSGLGEKLGPLLVQIPPSLRFDAGVAEAFLHDVRSRSPAAVVLEPRHPSWFVPEAEALLRTRQVARVAADPPPVAGADHPGGWEGLVYMRLHGSPKIYSSNYEDDALAAIRARLTTWQDRGATVWCIFDNTAAFHATANALTVTG